MRTRNMGIITKKKKDPRAANTNIKRDIRKDLKPQDITTRRTRTISIRSTSSTIARIRRAIIRNMVANTSPMKRRKGTIRKDRTMTKDMTKRTKAKKDIIRKDTMTTSIRNSKENTDMISTTPITITTVRRVAKKAEAKKDTNQKDIK